MLIFCKNGVVHAWHDDNQDFDHTIYEREAGVDRVIPVPNGTSLERAGENPPHNPMLGSMPDRRPFAEPRPTKELLLGYAAYKRWRAEISGVVVGGVKVPTNEASQAKVARLHQSFASNVLLSAKLKTADGSFADAAHMNEIFAAVTNHVQEAFAAEAVAVAAINDGTIKTWDDVDKVFKESK
jgi:hypothetical protein